MLSSIQPGFDHTVRAAPRVLASLIEAWVGLGHDVAWAVADRPTPGYDPAGHQPSLARLNAAGVAYLGDFSHQLHPPQTPRLSHRIAAASRVALPLGEHHPPYFTDAAQVVQKLKSFEPDVAVLFWDTWFEYLAPALIDAGVSVMGYLARPRYAATLTRLADHKGRSLPQWAHDRVAAGLACAQKRDHLKRMQQLDALADICAVDAAMYQRRGVPCRYIPNTWPDAFGQAWAQRRQAYAKQQAGRIEMVGNIGKLNATGNAFGIRFLIQQLLPRLDRALAGIDWQINLYGAGQLPNDLAHSLHPRIRLAGFVPDIDQAVLTNPVFLLFNNAGPYTGGYTRVAYAFSSGACLVAHEALAQSMPEARADHNALLGQTPDQIAALIAAACRDPALRQRIATNARQTYEDHYQPTAVARQLEAWIRDNQQAHQRAQPLPM